MVNIKTLKHCENLIKVNNEIKQYVKYTNMSLLMILSKFSQ